MAATMRITCLLLSFSLLCHNAHADDVSAATGVTVTKDAPTQGMTVRPTKVPTNASITTIQAVVDPVTQKLHTLAPTKSDKVKVTQALTIPPVVTSLPVATTVAPKVTPAPTQAQTKVATAASNAPPTVGKATLASVITTKASLTAATTGATQAPAPTQNVITVTPTGKVPTDGTTATIQLPSRTTVILKTTRGDVITAGTSATSLQQTSGTTKAGVTEQTTISPSPIPASTATSAVTTTNATPGATSFERTTVTTATGAYPKKFSYSLNNGQEKEEEKDLVEVCKRLMGNLRDGNCTLTWRHHKGKLMFDCVEINGKVKTALATQYYEEITKKPTDNKTLIAILASCGALLIMIIILAVCASHHRKPYNENQQHLTEELHTVENGYHDNPTLEVMEVQPEMQEKMARNGEFNNDGWIVPIDNMLKGNIPEEEDTHL
ncbi:podocalyxin [Syngnathus acus]|uniref:podocalyxin n=1 Tax=Syngnathus acus TaxID=161584 RepID=UPI0018861F0C|nr:podocalyxin [Syngnathus acus]